VILLSSPMSGVAIRRPLGALLKACVVLTKPRIIELLLVTTVPSMMLAARGLPDIRLTLAVLIGGILTAGSANTLNCYVDRDIDVVMRRTSQRPTATGLVRPAEALGLGIGLGMVGVTWLVVTANVLSGLLALTAILFYVFGYTLGLKRRTPQNIVWGGAAGCMPVLIGWVAVTGSLSWTPMVLFGVVFCWTPPHFWALALRYRNDYAAAGVPMLPVVAPAPAVTQRIVAYSWVMVAVSLLLWPVAPTGWLYPVAAAGLGGAFLYQAYQLAARTRAEASETALRPMRLFHASILYLTLLFLAVAVDALVR